MTVAVREPSPHHGRTGTARKTVKALLGSYGAIVFTDRAFAGWCCLLATLMSLRTGLSGLAAATLAGLLLPAFDLVPAVARLARVNALLVGLAAGALTTDWTQLLLWLPAGVLLSILVSAVLADWFWRLDHLSPLSLPFVVTAIVLSAMSTTGGLPPVPAPLFDSGPWPSVAVGFSKALGAALLTPQVAAGSLVFLAILIRSRYLALLALAGYAAGEAVLAVFHLTLSPMIAHWAGFNWILAAMAVGGIYTVPSPRGFLLALFAAALAALLTIAIQPWLQALGLPVITSPFLLTTGLILAALRKRVAAADPVLSLERPDLPEANYERLRLARFRGVAYDRPLVRAPFLGTWQVYQGFNGEHTHQPPWQHALDFFQVESGQSFRHEGNELTDYFCYGQPVVSPVWGEVAAIEDSRPDNRPGAMDTRHNWGNHVLIRVHAQCYVLLAHLQQGSCPVAVGQALKPGDPIGNCGNSGRSVQPHLHLHLQASPQLGDPTQPFALTGIEELRGERSHSHLNLEPGKGMRLSAPLACNFRDLLGLQTGRQFEFRVVTPERQWQAQLQVGVDSLGEFHLQSDSGAQVAFVDSGVALAFYDRSGPRDTLIDALILALGLIPNSSRDTSWDDRPSAGLLPLGPIERCLVALRHPLGAGVRSLYQRRLLADHQLWEISGNHGFELWPGKSLNLQTGARLDLNLGLREFSLHRGGQCLLQARLMAQGGTSDDGIPAWQARIDAPRQTAHLPS